MMKRRVAVVGIGTVNPAGNSVEESWPNIRDGVTGIDRITKFDPDEVGVGVTLAGEVKDFDLTKRLDKREARHEARFTQFALYAAAEAIEMSGLALSEEEQNRAGVIVSCGIGGLDVIEEQHMRGVERGYDKVNPFFIPMTISNMAAARIAINHNLKGMCSCPVTACAGGTNAIGDAFHRVRDGYEDIMVCGGTEASITKLAIAGFSNMKALCQATDKNRASIPFDNERSGFVMGEGAGILVLEEMEHAKARGAKILAEIVGYGSNCDAYHITSPAPGGEGGAACMSLAIQDANLTPEKISYINAHGTSTHLNDSGETKAIHQVFGEHSGSVMVSSTKGVTGHLLGGAGGVEAVISVKTLMEQTVPPTANYKVPDPECDLDYVPNEPRKTEVNYVLSNSLGFGGHNASIIFGKVD
ncbi:MAG: beta-ketoacyl-ACP synthase II [Lachnospiraceae bacterium]|nr:beta-ketoacyl-ACP synthase II [Lachnospiraceae bacterium]